MSLEEEAARWARENKGEVVTKLISNVVPTASPSAIFMAGLPGAGKTELAHELVAAMSSKVLFLDMDEIAQVIPGYVPERADAFRVGATILLERILDRAIKKKIDFVLDGTFGGAKALTNVDRALRHGYMIKVIYVRQEPELAWAFTKAREKVEHRAISMTGFVETYERIYENLDNLPVDNETVFLDVVLKRKDNSVGEYYGGASKQMVDELDVPRYTKEILRGSLERAND